MRSPMIALALVLLAGCQPIPHPFADQVQSSSLPALRPRDSAGITVLPVAAAGAPEERPLADALVQGLMAQDVPASIDAGNRGSFRLSSSLTAAPAAPGHLLVTLNWRLADAGGKKLGDGSAETDTQESSWNAGDAALGASLAADAVPKIVGLLADDGPPPAAPTAALVAVRGVSGAPGDGNTSLAQAIARALGRAGIAVASDADTAPLALTCAVAITPPKEGKQQVQIHWLLSKRDGGALGRADQDNAVPAGSLDGAWADIAYAVAAAAAPGIAELVHKAEPLVADAGAAPAKPPEPKPVAAPVVAVAVEAAKPPEPKPAAANPGPAAKQPRFLVQFGTYRDHASGAKRCAQAAKLAPAHLERTAARGAIRYRCRSAAPLTRGQAAALIAAAASAGHNAVLVPLPPPS